MKGVGELLEISGRLGEIERLMRDVGPECGEIARAVGVPLAEALVKVEWAQRGLAMEVGLAVKAERGVAVDA